MAKKKAEVQPIDDETVDFTEKLIRDLNKERGDRVAYNLSFDESPTHVKRWIKTGLRGLDFICSNRKDGGLPEGRIIEIFGPPSIGKSHLAAQICRNVQSLGGIAVYIDAETAISVENLRQLGVNVHKGFVYVNEHCTENILAIAESTILKARALTKNVPIVIVWDSVAASSPKAELDGEYDKESIGLQARAISKGMRKITGVIGDQNVLFVILNQTRTKIGVMHGDPTTTPGGNAIPFHASIRIKLGAGSQILNEKKEVIGINVSAKTIKNKVAPPFRKVDFQIHFGIGVKEHEELFDILRQHGPEQFNEKLVCSIEGEGTWKYIKVYDPDLQSDKKKPDNCFIDKAFHKSDFNLIMKDRTYAPYVDFMLEKAMIKILNGEPDIDHESLSEMEALANELGELVGDVDLD